MNTKDASLALSLLKRATAAIAKFRDAMPHRCLLCHQQTLYYHHHLCQTCRHDLPFPTYLCLGCANVLEADAELCGQCQAAPPKHLLITACDYLSPVKELISSLKYRRNKLAAFELARHLSIRAQYCVKQDYIAKPQLLIPVPLHPIRQRSRGFNQAQLIAEHLGEILDIRVANCCERIIATPAQAQLSAKQRSNNMAGAFKLIRPITAPVIAIIDDVYTTGATMTELAATINSDQGLDIQYWCITRTLI